MDHALHGVSGFPNGFLPTLTVSIAGTMLARAVKREFERVPASCQLFTREPPVTPLTTRTGARQRPGIKIFQYSIAAMRLLDDMRSDRLLSCPGMHEIACKV
jgi:hypothetical protein